MKKPIEIVTRISHTKRKNNFWVEMIIGDKTGVVYLREKKMLQHFKGMIASQVRERWSANARLNPSNDFANQRIHELFEKVLLVKGK